jgi:hypothetical protein
MPNIKNSINTVCSLLADTTQSEYSHPTFDDFKIVNSIKTTTVITIKLEAASNSSNFQRNNQFKLAYTTFFMECIKIFAGTNLCLNIEQRSNIILGIFDTHTHKQTNEIFTTVIAAIFILTNNFNKQTDKIKVAIFMDIGKTSAINFIDETIFTSKTLWLGNTIERTLKICSAITLTNKPCLFVTYDIYTVLDKGYKNKFLNSYYIFHICCFGNYMFVG